MQKPSIRSVELLAPARNADIGIEAIRHGADAVYIGGPAFGARAMAGNSLEDIARLCHFAHFFGAKVYVALNTILYDSELQGAEQLVWQLYRIGVDALIIQDLGLLRLSLPPIALHASTQMDNRTAEQLRFLEAAGFSQAVLARELGVDEIAQIHQATNLALEVFVHGALCVSYSGRCYASEYCFSRSANRGKCAQFCRLAFDLTDAEGHVLVKDKHLLSLKDMNRAAHIDELLEAGASSFKIEGRLKDMGYVKNVTAYYSQMLNEAIARSGGRYKRASAGHIAYKFTPQPEKSFNRGFTNYFLHGRTANMASIDTPKAKGEYVGKVAQARRGSVTVERDGKHSVRFANGDGLCFLNNSGKLQGFRVNRAEGDVLYPQQMSGIKPGYALYRNIDAEFERQLSRPSAERHIALDMTLREVDFGYALDLCDETGLRLTLSFSYEHQAAHTPQKSQICNQLSRLGNSMFSIRHVQVAWQSDRFIPSSVLATWRRSAVERMAALRLSTHRYELRKPEHGATPNAEKSYPYSANVSNKEAEAFLRSRGAEHVAPAFELQRPGQAVLMTCRYCLRHALHHCPKQRHDDNPQWKGALFLRLPDGRKFPLRFDCCNCRMEVLTPTNR